jgi:hypothetical protein
MGTFTKVSDYYRHLRNRGYEKLGQGRYSYVVAKPGSDRVIKMGRAVDGWPGYIEWSIIHGYDGTFAPRVYSLRFYAEFYVAVVERLVCTIGDLHRDNAYNNNYYSKLHSKMQDWSMWGEDHHGSEYADLREFCCKCGQAKFADDMHGGNVMLRKDGHLVVTDPCSVYHGKEETPSYKHR